MDIFTQKKFLIRIVILLVLLNLLLIGFFLFRGTYSKPPRQGNQNEFRDVSEILRRELNLSNEQVDQIRILRSSYFEKEEALAAVIKGERDSINMIMFNKSTNEELVRSLARRVADNDYKMELLRFEQAQKLKSVCTPEQLEKFENLIIEIRDYFRRDNQPKRKQK
jgi:periplasmic protein CpxP/Spy